MYVPITDHDDEEIEEFYNKLQGIINMVSKKDILIIQGDWNAKVDKDAIKTGMILVGLLAISFSMKEGDGCLSLQTTKL